MKKALTSLLLLLAVATTASAEMKTVWEGTQEIGNWNWDTRLELTADNFAAIANGDKLVVTMAPNTAAAGDEPWYNYQILANNYVEGRDPERTEIANSTIEEAGDVTVTLTDEQVALLKEYGLVINGHFVTVTKVAVGTDGETPEPTPDPEPTDGTTIEVWNGSTATGEWATGLELSYDNKPAALATAKVGDVITVTCTVGGENAQVQIANPEGWQPFDEDANAALEATPAEQTFSYTIADVATLELIQFNGIIVNGTNVTITKVELTTYPDSYNAVSITIGEAGVATYSNSSKSLDFTASSIKAYYASAVETGKVTLTPVTLVPAYTGIVVKGEAGTYEVPVASGEVTAIEGTNYLKAVGDWEQTIGAPAAEVYNYIFDETASVFSLVTVDTPVPARKAYLETNADITPATGGITLDFQDGGTGIEDIKAEIDNDADAPYYNLQGMRFDKPTRSGIYIHNGKKVIIK